MRFYHPIREGALRSFLDMRHLRLQEQLSLREAIQMAFATTSATLVVTSALPVVTMFAIRNKCIATRNKCIAFCWGSPSIPAAPKTPGPIDPGLVEWSPSRTARSDEPVPPTPCLLKESNSSQVKLSQNMNYLGHGLQHL